MRFREVFPLLCIALSLGAVVAMLTWAICGWLGFTGDGRVLIATQTPVALLWVLWLIAVLTNKPT